MHRCVYSTQNFLPRLFFPAGRKRILVFTSRVRFVCSAHVFGGDYSRVVSDIRSSAISASAPLSSDSVSRDVRRLSAAVLRSVVLCPDVVRFSAAFRCDSRISLLPFFFCGVPPPSGRLWLFSFRALQSYRFVVKNGFPTRYRGSIPDFPGKKAKKIRMEKNFFHPDQKRSQQKKPEK